jgi:hypothetical protein
VSRYYELSPVEQYCPECEAYSVGWDICRVCAGLGRVFIQGGPSFGCQYTLEDCKPGQIVTLGNGDRGRVMRKCNRGTPTTDIALIDPFLDEQARETTRYPTITGVASMSAVLWLQDSSGGARGREDHLDPLQKRTKEL